MSQQYFQFSVFEHFATAECDRYSLTLPELVAELTARENVHVANIDPADLADRRKSDAAKARGAAFSCSTFEDNVRGRENVIEASMIALDFDGVQHKALSETELSSILADVKALGFACIWYGTWSEGLRAVFPLESPVSAADYGKLFDGLRTRFRVAPDPTGRGAERLHSAPQVPTAERLASHRAGFVEGRLLSFSALSPAPAPAPAATTGAFAGLKLSEVRVGGPKCSSLNALTKNLAAAKLKNEAMLQNVSSLAWQAAERGDDQDTFAAACWQAAKTGLEQNKESEPVRSWTQAENDCRRFVRKAFEDHARQAAEQQRALTSAVDVARAEADDETEVDEAAIRRAFEEIPRADRSKIEKLILRATDKGGSLTEAGAILGRRYCRGVLTADVLCEWYRPTIGRSHQGTNIDHDIEVLRAAITAAKPDDWAEELALNKDGYPEATEENILTVFKRHPDCAGLFGRNLRSTSPNQLLRDAPWGRSKGERAEADPEMFEWLRELGLRRPTFAPIEKVVKKVLRAAPEFDPFLDYLKGVKGDASKNILDTFFVDEMGVEDTTYTRAVTRAFFISACARADKPGCWADSMLILYSPEGGAGKTKLWSQLVPQPEWSGILKDFEARETPLKMQRWVFSIADEIDKWSSKKSTALLKEFLTIDREEARKAYAENEEEYRRAGVLVGTTNVEKPLDDPSGARRYWMLEVTREADLTRVASLRDQIWFEAWRAYKSGEKWHFTKEERANMDSRFAETLTRREQTADGESILALMADCSGVTTSAHSRGEIRDGKLGTFKGQVSHGHYMTWISENQARTWFTICGRHNVNVKHALESAGLVRVGSKNATRWELPGKDRAEHENQARSDFADRHKLSTEQAAAMKQRITN